jgi:hypothetical protein
VSVLLGYGDGSFENQQRFTAAYYSLSLTIADFDGDGLTDLATANPGDDDVSVFLHQCRGDISVNVPDSFTVFRGIHTSGSLEDVFQSDDAYLKFSTVLSLFATDPEVSVVFEGTLSSTSPAGLTVELEASVTSIGIQQTIEMYNWISGQYETVDVRPASINKDLSAVIDLTNRIDDYVQSETGSIRARLGYRANGIILFLPWQIYVDQLTWTTNQ